MGSTNVFLSNLKKLQVNGVLCDLIIWSEERIGVKAHTAVIAAACPSLADQLQNCTPGHCTLEAKLPVTDVHCIINIAYSGQLVRKSYVDSVTVGNALLQPSIKNCQSIKRICSNFNKYETAKQRSRKKLLEIKVKKKDLAKLGFGENNVRNTQCLKCKSCWRYFQTSKKLATHEGTHKLCGNSSMIYKMYKRVSFLHKLAKKYRNCSPHTCNISNNPTKDFNPPHNESQILSPLESPTTDSKFNLKLLQAVSQTNVVELTDSSDKTKEICQVLPTNQSHQLNRCDPVDINNFKQGGTPHHSSDDLNNTTFEVIEVEAEIHPNRCSFSNVSATRDQHRSESSNKSGIENQFPNRCTFSNCSVLTDQFNSEIVSDTIGEVNDTASGTRLNIALPSDVLFGESDIDKPVADQITASLKVTDGNKSIANQQFESCENSNSVDGDVFSNISAIDTVLQTKANSEAERSAKRVLSFDWLENIDREAEGLVECQEQEDLPEILSQTITRSVLRSASKLKTPSASSTLTAENKDREETSLQSQHSENNLDGVTGDSVPVIADSVPVIAECSVESPLEKQVKSPSMSLRSSTERQPLSKIFGKHANRNSNKNSFKKSSDSKKRYNRIFTKKTTTSGHFLRSNRSKCRILRSSNNLLLSGCNDLLKDQNLNTHQKLNQTLSADVNEDLNNNYAQSSSKKHNESTIEQIISSVFVNGCSVPNENVFNGTPIVHSSNHDSFTCNVCCKEFSDYHSMIRHQYIHTGERPCNCSFSCGKITHLKTCFNNEKVDVCLQSNLDIESRSRSEMTSSMNITKLNKLPNSVRKHNGKSKKCRICKKHFNNSYDYMEHQKIHGRKEKKIECPTCGKILASPKKLEHHIRTHTGEKPYACHYCDSSFPSIYHRTRHERIHTREKRFQCVYCEQGFVDSDHLRNHKCNAKRFFMR